jgi:Na+-transporting methylmalonyl-CoA/oxaloacetate decarboxylase gamma subunit
MDAELVKWIVIGMGVSFAFIFLLIAINKGILKNFRAGKDGISFEQKDEKEKKVRSGSLNKMMDDSIVEYDGWIKDKATEYADAFRQGLRRFLDPFIQYPSGKRSVSGAIRFPLYNAIRSNKFKIKLRPENIENYLDGLMEKIRAEYDDVDDEQENFICPIHNTHCVQFPSFDELATGLRDQVKKYWLLPTKEAQIEMHRKKIELYKKYIPAFQDIEDDDRVAICNICIKKNEGYIDALLNGRSHAIEQGYDIGG